MDEQGYRTGQSPSLLTPATLVQNKHPSLQQQCHWPERGERILLYTYVCMYVCMYVRIYIYNYIIFVIVEPNFLLPPHSKINMG